jgi:hypothetical protein
MCVDETMMKWLMATLAGKKPEIDRVGLSYMLMGEARQGQGATPAKDPSQVKEWFYIGPHIMVVLPDSAKDALCGVNQDLCNNQPYTSLLSSADVATPMGHSRCKGRRQDQGGASEIGLGYTVEVECGCRMPGECRARRLLRAYRPTELHSIRLRLIAYLRRIGVDCTPSVRHGNWRQVGWARDCASFVAAACLSRALIFVPDCPPTAIASFILCH